MLADLQVGRRCRAGRRGEVAAQRRCRIERGHHRVDAGADRHDLALDDELPRHDLGLLQQEIGEELQVAPGVVATAAGLGDLPELLRGAFAGSHHRHGDARVAQLGGLCGQAGQCLARREPVGEEHDMANRALRLVELSGGRLQARPEARRPPRLLDSAHPAACGGAVAHERHVEQPPVAIVEREHPEFVGRSHARKRLDRCVAGDVGLLHAARQPSVRADALLAAVTRSHRTRHVDREHLGHPRPALVVRHLAHHRQQVLERTPQVVAGAERRGAADRDEPHAELANGRVELCGLRATERCRRHVDKPDGIERRQVVQAAERRGVSGGNVGAGRGQRRRNRRGVVGNALDEEHPSAAGDPRGRTPRIVLGAAVVGSRNQHLPPLLRRVVDRLGERHGRRAGGDLNSSTIHRLIVATQRDRDELGGGGHQIGFDRGGLTRPGHLRGPDRPDRHIGARRGRHDMHVEAHTVAAESRDLGRRVAEGRPAVGHQHDAAGVIGGQHRRCNPQPRREVGIGTIDHGGRAGPGQVLGHAGVDSRLGADRDHARDGAVRSRREGVADEALAGAGATPDRIGQIHDEDDGDLVGVEGERRSEDRSHDRCGHRTPPDRGPTPLSPRHASPSPRPPPFGGDDREQRGQQPRGQVVVHDDLVALQPARNAGDREPGHRSHVALGGRGVHHHEPTALTGDLDGPDPGAIELGRRHPRFDSGSCAGGRHDGGLRAALDRQRITHHQRTRRQVGPAERCQHPITEHSERRK